MWVFFSRWIIIACWLDETDFWGSQSIKFVMVTNFELRFSVKTAEFPREKNITFYFWIHYFVLNYSNGCVKVTDSFRWFNQSKLVHNRFYFSRFFVRKMLEICWKFSCHAAQYYKQTIMCRVIFRSRGGLVANEKDSDFMSTWHLPLNYKPGVSGLHMRGLWFIIHDQIIYRWLFYVQLPFKVCFCYFI